MEAVLLVELERDDANSLATRWSVVTARGTADRVSVDTALADAARPSGSGPSAMPRARSSPHFREIRRSLQVIEDACVPVARHGRVYPPGTAAAAPADIPVVMFGHAGDGHLHGNLLPESTSRLGIGGGGLLEEVTDAVVALSGTPSGEHGDGRLRAESPRSGLRRRRSSPSSGGSRMPSIPAAC